MSTLSPGGTAILGDLEESLNKLPALSGRTRWGEMAGKLVRAADLRTACAQGHEHHLAFHPGKPACFNHDHVATTMCDTLKGKNLSLRVSHCPEYQLCPSALNAVISSTHLVFCRADARERHISEEKQSVPRSLGVRLVISLFWRPALVGRRRNYAPEELRLPPVTQPLKPGPMEIFLKCKLDQDNRQLKTLQWPHTNHCINSTPGPPWSTGHACFSCPSPTSPHPEPTPCPCCSFSLDPPYSRQSV